MKILKRIIKGTTWFVIAMYITAVVMVHVPFVQTWLGTQIGGIISGKLNTKVSVGRIYLGFLNRIVVDDLKIYDQDSKLMVKSSRLAAKIDYAELIKNGRIYISSAQLFGLNGVFYKKRGESKANYQFVIDALSPKDKKKKSQSELSINSLIIRHGAIRYDDFNHAEDTGHGRKLDLNHLYINDISGHLIIPHYTGDSIAVTIKKLSLREKSGLNLQKLRLSLLLDKRHAYLDDLEVSLPGTHIKISSLEASYRYDNGKLDTKSLQFNGRLDNSHITFGDIGFVVPQFRNSTASLKFRSDFSGTADGMKINNLAVSSDVGDMVLMADGAVSKTGNSTRWRADIRQLSCTAAGIGDFIGSAMDRNFKRPQILDKLGLVKYAGNVSGKGNILSANGTVTSGVGNADIKVDKTGQHIKADIQTEGINIGELIGDEKLGIIAMAANVECDYREGGISNINVDGTFPRLEYNGYPYTDITAKGHYDKSSFKGTLSVNDPNGQVNIDGEMDLSKERQTTDIKATIRNLDLAALKITDKWEGAKFDLDISADTKMSEKEANLFRGQIGIRNFSMSSKDKTFSLDSMVVTARHNSLELYSDFGHAELTGKYKIKTIAQSFIKALHDKLPTLCARHGNADNKFTFNAKITKTDWLDMLFNIPLHIDSPLSITASVDDRSSVMNMSCNTEKFHYDGSPYENMHITANGGKDTLSVSGNVKKVMDNGHRLTLGILADAADDRLMTTILWDNNLKNQVNGTLNAETEFKKKGNGKMDVDIDIKPSHILVNDTAWNVLPSNIIYSGGDLAIRHFSIEHNRQHIKINGMATKKSSDSITVDMQDVDVSYLLGLVNFHSVEFSGYMTGKAYVKSVFYEPDAYADITVNNFRFEEGRLGKLFANVSWNKADKRIDINAHADDKDNAQTIITGYVSPSHNHIDLGIRAKDTNIEFLESFCGAFMGNIQAKANGEVRLHGPLNAINLTGGLTVDGSTLIKPTNVTYKLINDTIVFLPDNIVFNADTIYDRNGNIGIVNGALHHKNLSRLTYDINIETRNLLCYDTHGYGEDSFYGTAYGTGLCSIKGGNGRIDMDINVTPGKDSFIEYNAASPEAISDQQFITWHDKTEGLNDSITVNDSINAGNSMPPNDIPSDMRINFLVNMTPEATLRVLMDKNTNDYIALNGNGTIRASYFNKGSFDMFGSFVIDHGVYTLTIQNIIKKVFQFQQGGTIIFGGDPYDALLDLQAVYTVNGVPLSDLQLGNSFSSNNVRVDCLMNISGTPQAPHVDFNIDMPTVNEDAEQMVRTVINSEEEMNQQVVYLLSVGRFYIQGNNNSSDQERQNQTSLAMQSLLSGTISQQINTLLGNLVKNNNWTFGANISTGDEGFNNAEYEGLLSGKLLNNRLIINGQFGYRDNANATTSFIGDFDINYLLLPNGNIALKVYNQTNDRYFTKSSLNTQGIGLILKKDFNSLMDLFGINRKRKEEK